MCTDQVVIGAEPAKIKDYLVTHSNFSRAIDSHRGNSTKGYLWDSCCEPHAIFGSDL